MKTFSKETELFVRIVIIKRKRKIKNKTLNQNQQPNVDKFNKNRTLMTAFSNFGKTYLMIYFLLQKQEPVDIIKRLLHHCSNIKAQTSDEIQLKENYENGFVVSDDMLLSKQESKIYLFFSRGRHNNIDI